MYLQVAEEQRRVAGRGCEGRVIRVDRYVARRGAKVWAYFRIHTG